MECKWLVEVLKQQKKGNSTPLTMDLVVTSLSAPQSCLFPMQHTNK